MEMAANRRNMRLLADSRLLSSFAKLVGRLRIGNDKRYESMRQTVADYAVALSATAQKVPKMSAERDARRHAGRISRLKWFKESLVEHLMIVQQAGNLAEAEQRLYRHMKKYAQSKRLGKFLEMLEREKMAEKNGRKLDAASLKKAIGKLKGPGET